MVGYSEEELRAFGPLDLTHEEDRPLTRELMRDLAVGRRRDYQVEKRYRRKDGEPIWVSVNVSYVPSMVDGASAFYSAIVVDITDRKRAEAALRASETRWRRLFETSAAGMALATLDGRYIATNLAFQRMLGYSDQELQGRTPIEISYPDDQAVAAHALAEFGDGARQDYRRDKRYVRKDGTPLWVNVTVSVVPESEASPPLLAIYVDIDDRKRAETALQVSEERWRTVFEMAPVGIATLNLDERFATANPAFQRMLGYPEDELRTLRGVDITYDDDRGPTRSTACSKSLSKKIQFLLIRATCNSTCGSPNAKSSTHTSP